MPGLDYPAAPRMGRISLPSVTSPTPSRIRFGHSHYIRSPSPGVRSPWLHGSPVMPSIHDYAFASFSSTPPPHLPVHGSLFEDVPSFEGNVTTNALGLIFDAPLAGYQPLTPVSPPKTLPPLTPQLFINRPSSPISHMLQVDGHQHGDQEGHQPFLETAVSYIGDAYASPSLEQDNNNVNPNDITVEANQETGPVKGANAIAAARSLLNDVKEMKAEGEAVSFSILVTVVNMLEQKMSAEQLSNDGIDILDVIGSFRNSEKNCSAA